MKNVAAIFSFASFLIAAIAGMLLVLGFVGLAFVVSWGGTALILLGYYITVRRRRRRPT